MTLQELLTALQRKYKVVPRAASPSTRCPRPPARPSAFPSCTATRLTALTTRAWLLLLRQLALVPEASGLPEFSSCSPSSGGSCSPPGHLLWEALPDHPIQVTPLLGRALSQLPSYPLRALPTSTLLCLRHVPAFHSVSSDRRGPPLPCSVVRPLELRPPTSVAPGAGCVGDSFARDGRLQADGWFRADSSTWHRLCALLLCTAATYLKRGTSPPPEVEDPCPPAPAGTEQVINIYLTDE